MGRQPERRRCGTLGWKMILSPDGRRLRIVRAEFDLNDLPRLLKQRDCGRAANEGLECERDAIDLISSGFPDEQAANFVRRVCRWGGGNRIAGRVRPKHMKDTMSAVLSKAYALCVQDRTAEAVATISTSIRYLGISFASKQLRFLAPEKAVILDSVIRNHLGYAENIVGYQAFLDDCSSILALAQVSECLGPEFRNRLRICDIEVALYLHIQERRRVGTF
jgi:hypothetical protein